MVKQTHHALCNMVSDKMNTPSYNEASKAVLLILIRTPELHGCLFGVFQTLIQLNIITS